MLAIAGGMNAVPFAGSAGSLSRPARHWLEVLTRWGFVANALVYFIVGTLALRWALGAGGELTDPEGAFRALGRTSFGRTVIIALIPGFFSYAIWRMVAAVFDGDGDGNTWTGWFSRAFGILKGLLYAGLGLTAVRLAFGSSGSGSSWVTGVLRDESGRAILFLVASGFLAFACYEIYRALQAQLSRALRLSIGDTRVRRWVIGISRFGIGARGLVIGAFAVLLFKAAAAGRPRIPAAPQSIRMLGGVHPALYLVAAAGIISYGIYLVVLARYRRIETS
jgi:hypothetical protein